MPENDTQHPLFTELQMFDHGGHDLPWPPWPLGQPNEKSGLEFWFSTPKMPKNDTQHPLFTELLIFHHGGHDLPDLHDVEVNRMKNMTIVV